MEFDSKRLPWRGVRSARPFSRLSARLLALFALALPLLAAAAEYSVGPAPSWVRQDQPGEATGAHLAQANDGVSYLLVDSQVLATAGARTRYFRYVSRALNTRGVESVANLGIDFEPSWQRLRLHSVRVLRGGQALDKLADARIEVIQQEKELDDELIYNGSKTVKLFLRDIRVGDTIDYSFSLEGRNPVFGGHEFGSTDLQWGVPVAHLRARLLVPAGEAIRVRTRNSALRPVVSEHDGLREYRWQADYTTPLAVEEDAPFWYSPFAEAEWSEYADWAAVSRWALPLYRVPERLGPGLEAQARRIEAAEPTPVGRMLAVLRFVQGEVRYLGVETGRNTHAPNPPDQVFASRFGDCKDKALLTMALLRRLGVEAHAALLNTRTQRGVAERLPNPAAFDHVIVQARIGARHWWLDPTRPVQESDAGHLYQPDYGLALVVAPGTTTLSSMRNASSHSRRKVHLVFDARRQFSSTVGLGVVTEYEGGAAEAQRDELAGDSLQSLQAEYLDYYADSYPHIRLAAPMRVLDDRVHNRLVTVESYAIADIAGKPDQDGKHRVWIRNPDVAELLSDPETKSRKSPLSLEYPLEVSTTTQVLLPSSWTISEREAGVEDPAFSFHRRVRAGGGNRLVIEDEYRALADVVGAREMPRYTANLARARDELGYALDWSDALLPPPAPSAARVAAGFGDRINWALVALAGFALLAFARLAGLAWRHDPAPARAFDACAPALGGWLLPYTLVVLAFPLRLGWQLWAGSAAYGSIAWSATTTFGGAHYQPLLAPLLLAELLCQLGLLVAALLLLRLYFARRSGYPRLAVAVYAAACAWQGIDLLLASAVPGPLAARGEFAELARFALVAAACSAYLLVSRRVAATFVRRLEPRSTQAGPARHGAALPSVSVPAPEPA
jgi:hypothetical protein